MVDFSLLIGGEAGFGIMTTGAFFSKISIRLGYHIFDYVEYPSLIRGGHNAYMVHVSDERTKCLKETIDYLICLNKETYDNHKHQLHTQSVIIYDRSEFDIEGSYTLLHVPFKEILQSLKGQLIMKNTIALGAMLAVLGSDLRILHELLEETFGKKGEQVVQFNQQFAEKGFNYVKSEYSQLVKNILIKKDGEKKLVLSGNEAFSLGAVIADCKFYVAYPMTPSSTVLSVLAGWQTKTNMVVRHAEDEISVINTALGSSFAGVRSAVGTSGGGFALMVESISYSGIAEIPIVIFLAQRPGPATGMPTWTEQGDLLFTVHSGHGEFQKIVLAAGDVDEVIALSAKAFNLADQYQLPVIVMSEMLLSESHTSIDKSYIDSFLKKYKIQRGKTEVILDEKPYLRYKITNDGISPRLIPGAKGAYYQANSYEHHENSHTTEDANDRINQVHKRAQKWNTYLKHDFELPTIYGNMEIASAVCVTWGGNKGALLKAQKELQEKGIEIAILHFTHLYPLAKENISLLFSKNKRFVLVENNSEGQLGKLLRMEIGIDIQERILRYDGRAITPSQIVTYFSK